MKKKVNDIIEQLGGKRNEAETLLQRGSCLRRELSSKAVLLLVDNVWDEKQLRETQLVAQLASGSMVLVTSRSRWPIVLPHAIEVKGLGGAHATKLFMECAGLRFSSMVGNTLVLLEKIVRGCCRMPLMIEVAGRSLRSRSSNPQRWQVWALLLLWHIVSLSKDEVVSLTQNRLGIRMCWLLWKRGPLWRQKIRQSCTRSWTSASTTWMTCFLAPHHRTATCS